MSPELKRYYQSVQQWIDNGCPDKKPYYIEVGLCNNTKIFEPNYHKSLPIYEEIGEQLLEAGLDINHPFNQIIDYFLEENKFTNQARLDWVKLHSQ